MLARTLTHALLRASLLGVLATSSIGAFSVPEKTTYFTFSKAVQIPGVALPAGTYVFEVVNPLTSANVVSVASRDRSKIYLLQVTRPVERPRLRDMKAHIQLGEAPAGMPPTVKSWFPEGETIGREFIY